MTKKRRKIEELIPELKSPTFRLGFTDALKAYYKLGQGIMAENSDILKEMLSQTERDYVGWNPDEKPQVAGIVADIATDCDCGGFGKHNIIFIDEGNGDGTAVHCFHTTLRSQVDSKIKLGQLSAGDLIAISHRGTQVSKTKGHADINLYRVVIRARKPATQFGPDGVEFEN